MTDEQLFKKISNICKNRKIKVHYYIRLLYILEKFYNKNNNITPCNDCILKSLQQFNIKFVDVKMSECIYGNTYLERKIISLKPKNIYDNILQKQYNIYLAVSNIANIIFQVFLILAIIIIKLELLELWIVSMGISLLSYLLYNILLKLMIKIRISMIKNSVFQENIHLIKLEKKYNDKNLTLNNIIDIIDIMANGSATITN